MPRALTLDDLRRHAVTRSLFRPTSLPAAIDRLGFVQADPLRAPARAQDLTLRHRVAGYRAGDLERRYPRLAVEEDFFINYGFLPRAVQQAMHPRLARTEWDAARWRQAREVQAFVRERGQAHPREVDAAFAHGKVKNWFGGTSNASTELLDGMHYRGLLRVARREGGTRVYAAVAAREAASPAQARQRMDAMADLIAHLYAPLPAATLSQLVSALRAAAPQWADDRGRTLAALKARLAHARLDGADWYWPASERPQSARHRVADEVRLLAPFDPVVWDRRRFERLWGWAYRFEAYTPAAQRQRGHYALPLLWRDRVIGWANVAWRAGQLQVQIGHVAGQPPDDPLFHRALAEELQRLRVFLGGEPATP